MDGILISIFTVCRRIKAHLHIYGAQGSVAQVIRLTRLDHFLPLINSYTEAYSNLTSQSRSDGTRQKTSSKHIIQDDAHPLFEKSGMLHKEFHLDLKKIRHLAQHIVKEAPHGIREGNLLEQQISELIKNGVLHGNKNDPNKRIGIWFYFSSSQARIIVQDDGEGFKDITTWNTFFQKKCEAFERNNSDEMMQYLCFRTEKSRAEDGGNALFAAIEYWNRGLVFNLKGNCVAAMRSY